MATGQELCEIGTFVTGEYVAFAFRDVLYNGGQVLYM